MLVSTCNITADKGVAFVAMSSLHGGADVRTRLQLDVCLCGRGGVIPFLVCKGMCVLSVELVHFPSTVTNAVTGCRQTALQNQPEY